MTEFSTVFATVSTPASADLAVRAMMALRRAANARVVGLHVSTLAPAYGLVTDLALAAYIEVQMEAIAAERSAAESAFARACKSAGVAFDWRSAASLAVSPHVGFLTRAADLVLWPEPDDTSMARHEVAEVVFASGRPVLAVPRDWQGTVMGSRVLIAWNGGREAARATFDALPILTTAEAVRVVSIQESRYDQPRQFTPADDICTTLARHGVRVEAASVGETRGSVRAELEVQALEFGADLAVMGCYGRSRLRERILGGVSRDMLRNLPFPLLLAN